MEIFDILEKARQDGECVLAKDDGEAVADLDFEGTDDFPWIRFRFRPLPAWVALGSDRNIFYSRQGLNAREVIESRIMSIQQLDLWLFTADKKLRVGDFLFSIRGDHAYFRPYPRGKSIGSLGNP